MPARDGLITTAELAGILEQPDLRLFDCTTYLEYQVLMTFTKGAAADGCASLRFRIFLFLFNGLHRPFWCKGPGIPAARYLTVYRAGIRGLKGKHQRTVTFSAVTF